MAKPPEPQTARPGPHRNAEALRAAKLALAEIGVEGPRFEAEVLLMHAAGWDRASLYSRLDDVPEPTVLSRFQRSLQRRLAHEPVAYIVGHREFYGLDFLVNPHVLIPRPETEQLVEEALRWLHSSAGADIGAARTRVADVGTGSGAIAIALAVHAPELRVSAIDTSKAALAVAKRNARRHGVESRITFVRGDLLEPLSGQIDLIVANLPYIPEDEILSLPSEIKNHEPLSALKGGPTGLEIIELLLEQAVRKLTTPGLLLAEIGADQGEQAMALASRYFSARAVSVLPDLAQRDRILAIRVGIGRA